MIKIEGNPALIPASFITFTETNWEQMYEEYLKALKIVKRYKKWLQNKNKGKKLSLKQKQYRTIIYRTEDEIVETLQQIERYLPNKEYSKKYKQNKMIINNEIEFGYIPVNKENLGEIISNKQYRNELYKILEEELSPQQFKVISLYYGGGMTQELVGQELGITQQTVRDYLEDAYYKIIISEKIKDFLK